MSFKERKLVLKRGFEYLREKMRIEVTKRTSKREIERKLLKLCSF